MGGIFIRAHADLEDRVIAGVSAFVTQPRARDPEQRVEPEDRTHELGGDLHCPIATPDMRQLVRQHDARARFVPCQRLRREQDNRPPQTPCGEHCRPLDFYQRDTLWKTKERREFPAEACPVARCDTPAA